MLDACTFVVFALTIIVGLYLLGITDGTNSPPGPWGIPILGHLPFLGDSIPKTYQHWRKVYGDVFKIRLGSWNMVVLNGYETIKAAAEFENDAFSSRPDFVSISALKQCNDNADQISFSPFRDHYLQVRKVMASALRVATDVKNSTILDAMSEEANCLCDNILRKSDRHIGTSIDSDITASVAALVYRIIYGLEENQQDKNYMMTLVHKSNEFEKLSGTSFDVMPWLRFITPGKISSLKEFVMFFVNADKKYVSQRTKTFRDGPIENVADYIINFERQSGHSKENRYLNLCLLHSLKDLFLAGFGTTAATLGWLVLHMSAYPHVQAKIHREIDNIVGPNRAVNLDDRQSLHYTIATINETLRISSLAPFALPHLTTQDVTFKGFHIKKGTAVTFNLHSINHDEDVWGDPENFRPERLLTPDGQFDQARSRMIVPFSFGRRKCLGERVARMQIFVLFVTLMQRCSFIKPKNEVLDLTPEVGLIYRPRVNRVCVKDRQIKE